MKSTDIFEYTNFRDYLRDRFLKAKEENPNFSHRFLAKQLGLSTPNLILLVLQGKRNLTPPVALKLNKFLRHTKKEERYFDAMVAFLQAGSLQGKNKYFEEMKTLRGGLRAAHIESRQFDYYSHWYNPAVRELVAMRSFDGDARALARKLIPPVSPGEVEKAVDLLLSLGLIQKNGKAFRQTDPVITTGPEVHSLAVQNWHRKMALLASETYDRHLPGERTVTACTLTLTRSQFEYLKRDIADWRKRALEIAQGEEDSARVYQLNLQLFPLTKAAGESK